MNHNNHIEINDAVLMSYINAELSTAEIAAVERWLLLSSENQAHFDQLKKTWEISGQVKPEPVSVNVEAAWQNVLSSIKVEADPEPKVIPLQPKSRNGAKYWIGIAAMIAVIFTVYINWAPIDDQVNIMATTTTIKETLPDGSTITVNPASSITYPETFKDNERRVQLEGEAFFEVERDESQPFIVDLPQAAYVKVLGTSFTINTSEDEHYTTVMVKTGKVEFGIDTASVILIAGEKGRINQLTGEVEKEIEAAAETSTKTHWIDNEIRFDGDHLEDVIDVLREIYDVKINIKCRSLKRKTIRHTITKGEGIQESLSILSEIYGISVEEINNNEGLMYILDCHEN